LMDCVKAKTNKIMQSMAIPFKVPGKVKCDMES